MDRAEELTKSIFEAVIPESRMRFRSQQSNGEYDFDLYVAGQHVGSVEATGSWDEKAERTNARICARKKGGPVIKAKLCKKSWVVFPSPNVDDIKLMRKAVDKYLSVIEANEIERFWSPTDSRQCIERIYEDVGIVRGAVIKWEGPPQIVISFPIRGGAVGPQLVDEAIRREALKDDNRKKLGKAVTVERHLAVYVPLSNGGVWCALLDFGPLMPPQLPSEITEAWVFAESHAEHQYTVWRAKAGLLWSRMRVILKQ